MKKKTGCKIKLLFLSMACVIGLSGCVSSPYSNVPVAGRLHQYNTIWDKFEGTFEVGKLYQYDANYYRQNVRFKALQILTDGKALFQRAEFSERITREGWVGLVTNERTICEPAIILVQSNQVYVDGITLKSGIYECTGTYTYTALDNTQKTVYAFKEYIPPKSVQEN